MFPDVLDAVFGKDQRAPGFVHRTLHDEVMGAHAGHTAGAAVEMCGGKPQHSGIGLDRQLFAVMSRDQVLQLADAL